MKGNNLDQAVTELARATHKLADEELDREYTWRKHPENLRLALLGSYHELRDLAASLAATRQASDRPITTAQRVLGQYHTAYQDLQAVLLGVGDEELDLPPAAGEWPLRRVLKHIIGADLGFYALVHYALEQRRAGQEPARVTEEEYVSLVGPEEEFEQTLDQEGLAGIQAAHRAYHDRIIRELSGLSEEDLKAGSAFWEGEPLPVRYRLHRFDAHMRQHTIQVEKTLAAIDCRPNEARRLLRLVYNGLAEVENALLGAWDHGLEQRQELAKVISDRAGEVAKAA